jgi:hypothetical protein
VTTAHVREITPGHRLTFAQAALQSMERAPDHERESVGIAILRARRADRGLIALANGWKRSIPPCE